MKTISLHLFLIVALLSGCYTQVVMPKMFDPSDILLKCPPDLYIYIDDIYRGTSNEGDKGMYAFNIKPGTHIIRIDSEDLIYEADTIEVVEGHQVYYLDIKIIDSHVKPIQ